MEVSTEDESGDDEVASEMGVYLSKSLNDNLYLLQYPVLNSKRRFGATGREFVNIKPQNKKIEMDFALDISSPNYDQSKGEQIALNVDGNAGMSQTSNVFESNVMDKQTLNSSLVPTRGKRYVCGVIQNGNLHLTPISHVMQLRPSFKYMDRAERRVAQAAKAKATAEADSSQDEAEEAKTVTLRLKGSETEAARLARERSYAAYEKRLADEKWMQAKVHHKADPFAERERQRLICQKTRESDDDMDQGAAVLTEMVQTPSQYLTNLAPIYTEHAVDNTALPSNVLSVSLLKNENLGEQLRLLMKNAKIINFSHLLSILPNNPDRNAIVRSLQSFAVLVKGCWIVKSEVLYPPKMQSPLSGTSAEILCRSRDYILYMFTRKEYLVRKEITSTVKIPGDEIRSMLDEIAVMRVGLGWRLRLAPDHDFMKRFPEVCDRQEMLWKAQGVKLAKQMNLTDLAADVDQLEIKKETITPPRRKKTSSTSEQKSTTKKSPKTSKRQRKTSGHKSSPVNNSPTPSSVQVKPEPMSPPVTVCFPNANHPLNDLNSPDKPQPMDTESSILPDQTSPSSKLQPFVTDLSDLQLNNIQNLSPKINIAGVNSTVQSVANEMIKIGSPPNQKVQYYVPQMNIATPKLLADCAASNGGSLSNEKPSE